MFSRLPKIIYAFFNWYLLIIYPRSGYLIHAAGSVALKIVAITCQEVAYLLADFYVFIVFCQVVETAYLLAGGIFFVLMFCLDKCLASFKIDGGRIIWPLVLGFELLMVGSVWFYGVLRKNLFLHQKYCCPEYDRYFGYLDRADGKFLLICQTDYIWQPRGNFIIFAFYLPVVTDKDEVTREGLVRKKLGSIELGLTGYDDGVADLDIFAVLKNDFLLGELTEFISQTYYNTGKKVTSYGDYLEDELKKFSDNAVERAEETAAGKDTDSAAGEKPAPLSRVMHNYLQIVAEDWHPKLFSNVTAIEVEHSSGDGNLPQISWEEAQGEDEPPDELN